MPMAMAKTDNFYDLDNDGLSDLLDPDAVGGTAVIVSGTDIDGRWKCRQYSIPK